MCTWLCSIGLVYIMSTSFKICKPIVYASCIVLVLRDLCDNIGFVGRFTYSLKAPSRCSLQCEENCLITGRFNNTGSGSDSTPTRLHVQRTHAQYAMRLVVMRMRTLAKRYHGIRCRALLYIIIQKIILHNYGHLRNSNYNMTHSS